MRPADTSPKIWEVHCRRLAEMSPQEKVDIVADLTAVAYSLQHAVMRRDDPSADDDDIAFRIAVTRFGEKTARKIYRK